MRIAGIAETATRVTAPQMVAEDRFLAGRAAGATAAPDFAKLLGEAVRTVNQTQMEADSQAQLIATGQAEDIHSAVLAMSRAQLSLQLTIAVTNRAVEAYKEITHLQI